MPTEQHKYVSDGLSGALRSLEEGMRQEILVHATKRACKPIEVAAKRFAKRSEETGALRDSITTKVVNYPKSGKAVGLVGPDRAARVGGRKAGRLGRHLADTRKPSKYAHLIEYGHAIAVGGSLRPKFNTALLPTGKFSKSGRNIRRFQRTTIKEQPKGREAGWVKAKPFIRPAVITTKAQQEREFSAGIEEGWTKMVNREVSSGRHVRR